MDLIFENKDGLELVHYSNIESLTFKEGDKIQISVSNENKDIWIVEDLDLLVEVIEIKTHIDKRYPRSGRVLDVSNLHIVTVTVKII